MADLYIQPKNTMPRIDAIWAFLSVDPKDGNEGACAFNTPLGWAPMIAADETRLKELTILAKRMAKQLGITIKLVKFTKREEVREFAP